MDRRNFFKISVRHAAGLAGGCEGKNVTSLPLLLRSTNSSPARSSGIPRRVTQQRRLRAWSGSWKVWRTH